MFIQSPILFLLLSLVFFFWGKLMYKNGIKKVYFFYYFLNLIIFYGPLLYYKMGFTSYSNVVSNNSLYTYSIFSFIVGVLNIFFFKIYKNNDKFIGLQNFFIKYAYGLKYDKRTKHYFIAILSIVTLYIIIYFKYFPLVRLIQLGELGERLDTTGATPFYITFSAISMVFVPSAFFYFRKTTNNKLVILFLLLFTLFVLTAGGNKGIVSFFLIFYAMVSVKKIKIFNLSIVILFLFFIYAITKGITTFNSESLAYLLESPFRRLFAAQGVGFIGRIEMLEDGRLFLESKYLIKQQVFSEIYRVPLGTGTSPTHFLGDIYVNYGSKIMWGIYVIYLVFFVKLILLVDKCLIGEKYAHVLWNFFVVIFLFIMTGLSLANMIRIFFVLVNLFFINVLPRINIKSSVKV